MLTKAIRLDTESVDIRYAPGGPTDLALWPSMGEYPIYDRFLYEEMTTDEVRNQQYRRAIAASVRDRVVLEIGTGRDLLWTRECAKAGARRVYAVEVMEEAYRHASLLVRKLGLEDVVVLLHGNSMALALPERAEVCVSEIIGNIGSSEGAERVIQDAKDRLLTENAILIPQRCVTEIAALSLPDAFLASPHFTEQAVPYVERLLGYFGKAVDLRLCFKNVPPAAILSDNAVFEDLDFYAAAAPRRCRKASLVVQRRGRLSGFLLWIRLFCAPTAAAIDSLNHQTNWRPMFLPIFHDGIAVAAGDRIDLAIETTLSADGIHPDYRVSGTLVTGAGELVFDHGSMHDANRQPNNLPFYRGLLQRRAHPAAGGAGAENQRK